MTKFKAGDKFIPHKPKENKLCPIWIELMDGLEGRTLIIERVFNDGIISSNGYHFNPDWCEKVETVSEPPMQITYERALELGFTRHDSEDTVFFERYGYPYFYLELEIGDRAFEWDIHTHRVNYFVNGNLVKENITSSEFDELRREDSKVEILEDSLKGGVVFRVSYNKELAVPLNWVFSDKKDAEMFKELLLKAK